MTYTPEQLREMAQTALSARDAGSVEWLMLVIQLTIRTGLAPDAVELQIVRLAA